MTKKIRKMPPNLKISLTKEKEKGPKQVRKKKKKKKKPRLNREKKLYQYTIQNNQPIIQYN